VYLTDVDGNVRERPRSGDRIVGYVIAKKFRASLYNAHVRGAFDGTGRFFFYILISRRRSVRARELLKFLRGDSTQANARARAVILI